VAIVQTVTLRPEFVLRDFSNFPYKFLLIESFREGMLCGVPAAQIQIELLKYALSFLCD
jgi:hypothetical protein